MFSKNKERSEVRTSESATDKARRFRRRSKSRGAPAGALDDHRSSQNEDRVDEDSREEVELEDVGDDRKIFSSDKRQKKLVYRKYGDPAKVLTIVAEEDIPEPTNERHVVIKIMASTVSHYDCMLRKGVNFDFSHIDLPTTPGGDVVGYVLKVGSRVQDFKKGDRVAALVRKGGNARYISVNESDLVSVPRSVDACEAASLVATYMTAYQSLRLATKDEFVLTGKRILITGGIEPVGQALIQMCFRAGAEEVYATAPENRMNYVKSVLGARALPAEGWLPQVKGNMDVVIDRTCNDTLSSPHAALNDDGILICIGMSSLVNSTELGYCGAPLSAYWANFKCGFLTQTKKYDVFESFAKNKKAFKVRSQ